MPVHVRRASGADADALAAVAAITFPLACPPHTTDEAKAVFILTVLSAERFREYIADPARHVLLAQEDGETIGYAVLVEGEPSDPDVVAAIRTRPTSELSKCYVLPGHHGAGVAQVLMDAALDTARTAGARGVWLGVNEENGRAQRFYAKQGFEPVGMKRFRVGDRLENDYVLERRL